MKTTLLPCTLAAATLLSSCGIPYFSCHTAELFDPPDKRVALINGTFPKRAQNTYTPTAYWTLDGRTYTEVTVQYARPNRPFLRQSESGFECLYARPMTAEEMQEDFTIDPAIPARRYLISSDKAPIPAEEFDFRRAKRWKETPQNLHCLLVKNEFPDIPGTPSTWRSIAQAPPANTGYGGISYTEHRLDSLRICITARKCHLPPAHLHQRRRSTTTAHTP